MVECPLCGQSTSKSSARLIQDSCGHTKCRLCLLKEESGCQICHINAENSPKNPSGSPQKNFFSHCQSESCIVEIIQDESVYDNNAILPDINSENNFVILNESDGNNCITQCNNGTSDEHVDENVIVDNSQPAAPESIQNDTSKISKPVDKSDAFKKPSSPKIKNLLSNKNQVPNGLNKTPDHFSNLKSPELNLTDYLIFKKPNEKGGYTYSVESPSTPNSYRSPEFQLTDYLIFKSPNDRGGVSYSIGSPRISIGSPRVSNHKSADSGILAFDDLCIGRVEEIQFDSNCDKIEVSPAIDIRLKFEQDKAIEREAQIQKNRNYVYNQSRSKLLQLVEAIDKIEGINNLNNVMNEKVAADERSSQEVEKCTEEVAKKDDENKENEENSMAQVVTSTKEENLEEVENSDEIINIEELKIVIVEEEEEEKPKEDETKVKPEKKNRKVVGKKKAKTKKKEPSKATREYNMNWSHIIPLPDDPTAYKCSACDKVLKNFANRYYHRHCATGKAAFKCEICDRNFAKKSHYEYHERVVHTGDRPYKCDKCDKSFVQRSRLNRHAFSHTVPSFVCDHCGKGCLSKDNLKRHLETHEGYTSKCRFCPKVYKGSVMLKRHERTHLPGSSFECGQCRKTFKQKIHLTRHEKWHKLYQLKPYSCCHCKSSFACKLSLRRHMSRHFSYPLFTCEYCETEFKRKDNLKRHVNAHHPELQVGKADATQQQQQPKLVVKQVVENLQKARITEEADKTMDCDKQVVKPKRVRKSSRRMSSPRAQINFIDPINSLPAIPLEMRDRLARISFTEPIPLENARLLNQKIEESSYCSFPGLTRKVDAIAGRRGSASSGSKDGADLANQKRVKTGNKQDAQQKSNNDFSQTKMDGYVHWRRRTAENLRSRLKET